MAKRKKDAAEATIRTIRRVTRKKYTADDKIRIVLDGLRGESRIRELCRREGIATNLYRSWSKGFLEAGKQRLLGDAQRQATSREVTELRAKADQLKHLVAELSLKNCVLRKTCAARNETATAVARLGRREARAHSPGLALGPTGAAHTRCAGAGAEQLLRRVRRIPGRRGCGPGAQAASRAPTLELHSRQRAAPDRPTRPPTP